MPRVRVIAVVVAVLLSAQAASAACVNRFVTRRDGPRQVVTLLTGKLTFQEAQELAKTIQAKQTPPLEWVDDSGKTVAKQFGELKVVRPMPVGCDGNASGVIMIAVFPSAQPPSKKMLVKLDGNNVVAFDEQAE